MKFNVPIFNVLMCQLNVIDFVLVSFAVGYFMLMTSC